MARIERVIEGGFEGTYRGEVLRDRPTSRDGRGVMEYHNGSRYEGEWRNSWVTGRGTLTFRNGDVFDGEFFYDRFHGRGAYGFGDGRGFYDGAWACGFPTGGAALDGNGVVWRALCDGRTVLYEIWEEGGGLPAGWTRAGVRVTAGRPPVEAAGSGEWTGAWAWEEERGWVEGRLRGLRPVAGVETDAGGGRRRVTYDGERTLAERPVITSRTVGPLPEMDVWVTVTHTVTTVSRAFRQPAKPL
jgi:hypothetical protein